jgi:hypothetical protein
MHNIVTNKILILVFIINFVNTYSLIDILPIQENDWESSLFGKPVCIDIPSNMSLCQNINYNQMKIPNLVGHETVEEVIDLFFY